MIHRIKGDAMSQHCTDTARSAGFFLPLSCKQEGAVLRIEGYASVFFVRDNHDDIVVPGAFGVIEKPEHVKLLWQHRADTPVGVIRSLKEDAYGLAIQADILLHSVCGKEAATLLKGGALSGLSIGYRTIESSIDPESGARLLEKAELWEISLVTFPANNQAHVTSITTLREREKELRMQGHSRKIAKRLVSKEHHGLHCHEYGEIADILRQMTHAVHADITMNRT